MREEGAMTASGAQRWRLRMSESTDLIRRLDSAISTKSLHPEYARGLLREAKDALTPETGDETWDERRKGYRSAAYGLSDPTFLPPHLKDATDEPT